MLSGIYDYIVQWFGFITVKYLDLDRLCFKIPQKEHPVLAMPIKLWKALFMFPKLENPIPTIVYHFLFVLFELP